LYAFEIDAGACAELVLRLYPSSDRARVALAEAQTLRWLYEQGFAVPRLIDAGDADGSFGLPFLVMERAPGRTAAAVMARQPTRIPTLLRALALKQVELHSLPTDSFPEQPSGFEIDRRLDLAAARPRPTASLEAAHRWVAQRADIARRPDDALCHYDLHPMNALVDDGGRVVVIDWAGSAIGSSVSDLARSLVLFTWAAEIAPARLQRTVLRWAKPSMHRHWIGGYEGSTSVDRPLLCYWMAFHAYDGWAQTVVDAAASPDDPRLLASGALERLFASKSREFDGTT
jgi:aminoglycoside phosphotransferase (APT) family kinase protein